MHSKEAYIFLLTRVVLAYGASMVDTLTQPMQLKKMIAIIVWIGFRVIVSGTTIRSRRKYDKDLQNG